MKYTIRQTERRIEVLSDSGAIVAWLLKGSDAIVYDRMADTREAMGWVNHEQEMATAGLNAITLEMIAAMPGRDIEPESEVARG